MFFLCGKQKQQKYGSIWNCGEANTTTQKQLHEFHRNCEYVPSILTEINFDDFILPNVRISVGIVSISMDFLIRLNITKLCFVLFVLKSILFNFINIQMMLSLSLFLQMHELDFITEILAQCFFCLLYKICMAMIVLDLLILHQWLYNIKLREVTGHGFADLFLSTMWSSAKKTKYSRHECYLWTYISSAISQSLIVGFSLTFHIVFWSMNYSWMQQNGIYIFFNSIRLDRQLWFWWWWFYLHVISYDTKISIDCL